MFMKTTTPDDASVIRPDDKAQANRCEFFRSPDNSREVLCFTGRAFFSWHPDLISL